MVAIDLIDLIGRSIRVEIKSVEGASSKITNEPDVGMAVNIARADTCFCNFANSK
jgi:hypothetical protein